MKVYTIVFVLFFGMFSFAQDLNLLRKNLPLAVDEKKICEQMMNLLLKNAKTSVEISYLGVYQTIWANHVINPISKLSTFKKGTKNIDLAIKQQPNDVEIRFIRHSVQKNAPQFLGYSGALKADESFLKSNYHQVESTTLKEMIKNLLQ